jgi:hypothetical protein
VGPGAGLTSRSQLSNRPGEILQLTNPQAISTIRGPRVPGEAFASLDQIIRDFDRISGSPDIFSQISEGDWRSGYAVDAISELVRGRLKLVTYSLETTMRDLASKITRMIGMFYERGVHYDSALDLVGIHPEMFEFQVRAGLNLPASRRAQEQFLLQLLDRAGPVGSGRHTTMFDYVLNQSDLPGKEALVGEMQSAQERDTQQAMAAQQAEQENEQSMQERELAADVVTSAPPVQAVQ